MQLEQNNSTGTNLRIPRTQYSDEQNGFFLDQTENYENEIFTLEQNLLKEQDSKSACNMFDGDLTDSDEK